MKRNILRETTSWKILFLALVLLLGAGICLANLPGSILLEIRSAGPRVFGLGSLLVSMVSMGTCVGFLRCRGPR
ncbi:MAG: hypothetical protein ACI9TH_001636 [Kiritimatiellia bacterium]|jgi:hypothetical protein